MKLRWLKVENYGVFSGYTIDLSSRAPKRRRGRRSSSRRGPSSAGGFHLVYGPNEAGKSTLLQMIRELFFGFAHQNPYVFEWDGGEMAVEAEIETADGRRIRFRRRKGRRDTVVGEVEATGERIDEAELARVLGGANEELYRNVFGFSLTELASGEKSLERAGVSEALYGGGFGGLASFQRVQETLLERQYTLYKPTAKKPAINRLLTAIREKAREQREAALKPRDYDQMQADCQRLDSEAERLRVRLDELRREVRHLERIEAALPSWRRLLAAREELERITVPDGFPVSSAEEFRRARSRIEDLDEEIALLDEDLGDQRARLTALRLAPELIEREGACRALHQQVRQVQRFRADIPLRVQESRSLESEARARLTELSPDWDLEQLESLQTSLAQRETVQSMVDERDALRERRLSLEAGQPELTRRIAAHRARLEELAGVDDPTELRVLVERAPRHEVDRDRARDLEGEIAALEEEVKLLRPQVEARLSRTERDAGPVTGSPLESLTVPLAAAVRELQDRMGDIASDARATRGSRDEARSELARREEALERLDHRGHVPDREALAAQRKTRDDLWQDIRVRCLSGETPYGAAPRPAGGGKEDIQTLSNRYEREVAAADSLADERQDKAELVAQAEHLKSLIEEQSERVRQAEEAHAADNRRAAAVQREWRELWRPCGIEPLTPEVMLEWLHLHAQLKERTTRLSSLRARRRTLEDKLEQFSIQLRAAIEREMLGIGSTLEPNPPKPSESAGVDVLLEVARRHVELAAESARERARLESELPADEERLAGLDRELEQIGALREEWLVRWRNLLEEFGFPRGWDADLVQKIFSGLVLVQSKMNEVRSLNDRVAAMRQDVARFESEVADVARQVAPELCSLPPEDAVLELVERLDAARRAETERRTLAAEAEKVERRLAAKRERRLALAQRVGELLGEAGTDSAEEFETLARAATRARANHDEIRALERELRGLRGSENEESFTAALSEADPDEVATERERLGDEIATTDTSRQRVLKDAGIARKALDDLERSDAMSRVSLEMESLRAELAASCDEWAPLVLTRALVGRAMRRFEREHQPAMLRDVARLFESMTCGEYVAVQRKLDERGTLLVEDKAGALREPRALSRGTREQLYLAIRLAYVRRYCGDSEPLPLVMDDVLVNFDDERARSTLRVLAEESDRVQILFLTCHQSVVALVGEVLPEAASITLPRGDRDQLSSEGAPWRGESDEVASLSEDAEIVWRPGDIFDRGGRDEDRSKAARRGGKGEVPGKESSLHRRPGPLE